MKGIPDFAASLGMRLPLILQTEAAECGLACLAMVAGYHGAGTGLAQLRRRFGLSLRGATLKDLVSIATSLGMTARPLRLEAAELPMLATPCILHWDMHHFVVLKSVGPSTVVLHDPAVGLRRLPRAEALRHFTGVALELHPAPGFAAGPPAPRLRIASLLGRVAGLGQSLLVLAAMALAIETLAVTTPFFMQWVVDEALVSADRDLLLVLACGLFFMLMLRVTITAMRGATLIAISSTLKVRGRAALFTHLLRLPARYFESRHLGDVMSRFGSQETILQALTTDLVEILLDGIMSVITLVVMLLYAPALAGLVLAGALAYACVRIASYSALRNAQAEAIVWGAQRDSHFLETLRGMKTIKLFNAHQERHAHWLNLLVQTVNRQITAQRLGLMFRTVNASVIGFVAVLVIWLGAERVLQNAFSVGMLLAFISYKDQFLSRVSSLIDKTLDLFMLRLHAERLADIALTPPEPEGAPLPDTPRQGPVGLTLRGVRFRYGACDPWILDGIDLTIEPGESVAIVGPSGCGKTTLLRLLASLLEPSAGEVLVDGRPLTPQGVEHYRTRIGVVLQDDQLFAGSIADNICFFADAPRDDHIRACAALAAVHDDVAAMPMGFHTLIGDMGAVLSGGQKQRVLIARALYRDPALLLLDEAASHLDLEREHSVNAAVARLPMTRIVVAHRRETILAADRIVVLAQGKIVADLRGPAGRESFLAMSHATA
ncbi:ATP-binding cassette subfamily B protein RaxB [Pseudoduganella flava]|uniref:Cyclolysin secretion/processing ATP-binding protein CyaB n=1 Tax=Pseudoduganella flava TaxID=871742 RepID=A0A562PGL2_9BURK|nr:peptidase domain-containing ABC transporter [Pseudoduganella flava]QGZ40382.1 ATP-binding cassette domain-containing protein [Pseudoduganella flava]TWI43577.1 ATP-binding cassette subfamily B protein RaxB [Pseudoduganella flava]